MDIKFQMKNKSMLKRIYLIALALVLVFVTLDHYLVQQKEQEILSNASLSIKKQKANLSSEVHRLLYSLEEDMNFLIHLLNTEEGAQKNKKTVERFLQEHRYYFKARLVDSSGFETFKALPPNDRNYKLDDKLLKITDLDYFKQIREAQEGVFYFSFFEPNLIGDVKEVPERPTLRVAKKILIDNSKSRYLVVNIDGLQLLNIIDGGDELRFGIANQDGRFISFKTKEAHATDISSYETLPAELNAKIHAHKDLDAPIVHGDSYFFVQEIFLPYSQERWRLVAQAPLSFIQPLLTQERLRILFWEILVFSLIISFVIFDANRVQRQGVVEVLLRERTDFTHQVSHQLKTPLTIIYNELQGTTPSFDKSELQTQVRHLIHVVDSLLLLAQLDGMNKVKMEKSNFLDLLTDVLHQLAPKYKDKNIKIRQDLSDEVQEHPNVLEKFFAKDLMKSALMNLIDNAIKFTPPGSTIQLELVMKQTHLCLVIRDQGEGVPTELQARLFVPFSKGHLGQTGTGLGLVISQKILKLHGGKVSFLRNDPGAIFEVLL